MKQLLILIRGGSKVKYILRVFFLFFSLNIYSQEEIKSDTVICDNYRVIINIPLFSYKHVLNQNYEEGFFRTYPYNDSSFILIHYGTMVNIPFTKDICKNLNEYRLENAIYSFRGFCNDKYYREDIYTLYHIVILCENVNKSKHLFFNFILDNVKIEYLYDE